MFSTSKGSEWTGFADDASALANQGLVGACGRGIVPGWWRHQIMVMLLGSLVLYAASAALAPEAKAIGSIGIPYPSFVMRQECIRLDNVTPSDPRCPVPPYFGVGWQRSKFVWWEWDPSSDIDSISMTFYFNPTFFTPVPGSAGFLCSFTTSGNCPVESPGSGVQPIEIIGTLPIPGPSTGTSSIIIGTDTVTINATFSPPATANEGELFFAMMFDTHFPIDNALIQYSPTILPNAHYYVISYGCTTADNLNACGSVNYTASFRVLVPEPGTLSLLTVSLLGTVLLRRRIKKLSRRA